MGTEERKEEKDEREFKKRKVTAFSSGNRALKFSQFSGVKRLKLYKTVLHFVLFTRRKIEKT